MSISDILAQITKKSGKLNKIKNLIETERDFCLTGLSGSSRSLIISYLIKVLNRPILIITPDISRSLRYKQELEAITEERVEYLPSQEASPYEMVYSDSSIMMQQRNVLDSFADGNLKIMIASAKTVLNKYLSRNERENNSINIEKGASLDPQILSNDLIKIGYKRVTMVVDPGEFSVRGDITDIYPISQPPVRIEFFGDEVESLRIFDIDNQRSVKQIDKISIQPRFSVINTENNMDILKKELTNSLKSNNTLTDYHYDVFKQNIEEFLSLIESEAYFEGIEFFAPYLRNKSDDISDYLPKNTLIIYHESAEVSQKYLIQDDRYVKEYEKNVNDGLCPSLPEFLHRNPDEIDKKLKKFTNLRLDSFINDDTQSHYEVDCLTVPRFLTNLDEAALYINDLRNQQNNVIVISEYPHRVAESLNHLECPVFNTDNTSYNIASKDVIISKQGFSEGFILPDLKIAVITDTELFNKKIKKPTISKKVSKRENIDFLVSINDLNPNDFVVHLSHGIGKFICLSKQNIDGEEKDYLTIEYANNDKLYMPADQINLLSRYRGSGQSAPKLTKMGGIEWNNVKKKVKKSIIDIAQDLLNLYAQRAKTTGFVYEPDAPWQLEMEDAFPYTETPDQLQAINDTKSDMESEKPMDRLICGDVGFGKTEVALRAVFKAVLSGKQVAVLAPTTILAQQHYETFISRFKPYPLKIALLSRFKSPKEQKESIKKLITGDCDIVIGTHRLLQKDVQFKDLGMLVIDEEHRFGVAHKEKLKHLRAEIDVLTLSATPIPRTLYMAISGIRDLSLINTPPVNRAPIKTYIGQYNQSMVRTAINHELEREGQVFFVHNRVQSIYKVAQELQELIPDARIAVGHGQMNVHELEKVMYEFSIHNYDILVCTTIIETGLDIPNANTIIIDDADKFGLAQLYQMRGRVGRSETQAYAYCFYRPDKVLTKEATDRLKAIKDFTTLGSGYQIALRDLEIRGVGNILGSQQHGQMLAVGFDMYCNLLEEAVHELQGEPITRKEPPVVDINITAYIPDEWVGDKDQKMIEYKRLADVQSLAELEIMEEEWKDRFGDVPDVVIRLFKIIKLRLLASGIGINLVRETEENIRIFTDYDFATWRNYQNNLPQPIAKRLRWIKAPVTSQNGISILLLNNTGLLNVERLNILEELFYKIQNIQKSSL